MGSPLLTSAPYHIVERENGRCALQQILSAMTEMVGSMSGLPPRKRPQSGHRLQRLKRVKHRQHNGDISNRSDCHGPESRREQRTEDGLIAAPCRQGWSFARTILAARSLETVHFGPEYALDVSFQ
jgi:hypothetical protein